MHKNGIHDFHSLARREKRPPQEYRRFQFIEISSIVFILGANLF